MKNYLIRIDNEIFYKVSVKFLNMYNAVVEKLTEQIAEKDEDKLSGIKDIK